MSSTYIDLHNLSQIDVDEINVSNLVCDSIITTDLTVSGELTGLIAISTSIFSYTYTPATRTFSLSLATQPGIDYILITDSSGIFHSVLFTPLIYPLLSATTPILYDNTTGIFSLSIGSANQFLQTSSTLVNNFVTMSGDATLLNGVITIGNDKITTTKILDANVTPIKISLGSANQFLQTSSTLVNNFVTMSGDATLTNGVITIGNDKITTVKILNANVTNAKLANSSISLNGQTMSLGTTLYFLPANSVNNSMLFYSYTVLNGQSMNLGGTYSLPGLSVTNAMLTNSSITLGTNTMSLGSTTTTLNGGTNSTSYSTIVSVIPAGIGYTASASNNFKIDQVLRIGDCLIQNDDTDTYIDCKYSGTGIYAQIPKINIATITPGQVVNLGGSINYLSARFNNIVKFSINPMTHSTGLPFVTTNWLPIGHTASSTVLEASITIRSNLSAVRITVNMPLSNWGTTASNKHLTVCRNTTAAVYGVLQTTALLNNNYGMWHHLSGAPQYETIHFTWIDDTSLTQGMTYYYSVSGRGSTAIITPIAMGNNNYNEITLEELY